MLEQNRRADFVLVLASSKYLMRASAEQEPQSSLGATWEFRSVLTNLYQAQGAPHKYIPIVFDVKDFSSIPEPLDATTHYFVGTSGTRDSPSGRLRQDLIHLYARLTGRSLGDAPPIGSAVDPERLFHQPVGADATDARINQHPQVAYVRGIEALTAGQLEDAADSLTDAFDAGDETLVAVVRSTLVSVWLRLRRFSEAETVALTAEGQDRQDLLIQVGKARQDFSSSLSLYLLSRLRIGDVALVDFREQLHTAVVEALAGERIANAELLLSVGVPRDATAIVVAVSSDYLPSNLEVVPNEFDEFELLVTVSAILSVDVDLPKYSLVHLSDELFEKAQPDSGDVDSNVWNLEVELGRC